MSSVLYSHPSRIHKNKGLALELARYWKDGVPSDFATTQDLVYGIGFMNIKSPHFLLKKIEGNILIDLGAGDSVSYLAMAHLAANLGAKEYIAVDRYQNYSDAIETMNSFVGKKYPNTKFSAVQEDMLVYLSTRVHSCANLCFNGIDELMLIHNVRELEKKYINNLIFEITRVVPKDGIVFGFNSPFIGNLSNYGFQHEVKDLICQYLPLSKNNGIFLKVE